jgi:hypothetical protein
MKFIFFILTILISLPAISQKYSYKKKKITQKGSMYLFWGYNRSVYGKSTIHFTGSGYDFTIHKAKAVDKPETKISNYYNITTLTIPQFNIRMGYYTNGNWDLSVGYDHMKYVMLPSQEAKLTGYIDESANEYLNGKFNNEIYVITDKKIHYENSNGLNYITFQATYNHLLYATKSKKMALRGRLGFGGGAVVTQTDFNFGNNYVFDQFSHTDLKLTGFGGSLHSGLRLEFFNRLFVQSNWSAGVISLPNLQTVRDTDSRAQQVLTYADWQLVGGVFWYLKFKNGCNSCPDWH